MTRKTGKSMNVSQSIYFICMTGLVCCLNPSCSGASDSDDDQDPITQQVASDPVPVAGSNLTAFRDVRALNDEGQLVAILNSDGVSLDTDAFQNAIAFGALADPDSKFYIEDLLISPNNSVYVLFRNFAEFEGVKYGCEVYELTYDLYGRCILDVMSGMTLVEANLKPLEQHLFFDEAHNGYIRTKREIWKFTGNTSPTQLTTDQGADITQALVLADGSGFFVANSLYRWTVAGDTSSIINLSDYTMIARFPDNNVYLGTSSLTQNVVSRYSLDTETMLDPPWLAANGLTAEHELSDICGALPADQTLCGADAFNPRDMELNIGGAAYLLIDGTPGTNSIVKMYPDVGTIVSEVVKPLAIGGYEGYLVAAGLDSLGTDARNSLRVIDTTTSLEFDPLGEAEVEIFRLERNAAEGLILFDGQRFSDSKYVVGMIDVTALEEVQYVESEGKLSQFKSK